MNHLLRYGLVLVALLCAARVGAAPLPPFPPVDVSGTIAAAEWYPERQVQGVAGMSGTAGQDRTFAAHYVIRLVDYHGVGAAAAWEMTRLVDWHALADAAATAMPPFILLRIDHPDRTFLRPGMRIRISGYSIGGDEGGTWTTVRRIDITWP